MSVVALIAAPAVTLILFSILLGSLNPFVGLGVLLKGALDTKTLVFLAISLGAGATSYILLSNSKQDETKATQEEPVELNPNLVSFRPMKKKD
eukprot:CAMPEP_0113662404 /NCGR_PEP_ID=MMETSP0038_2-20120614/551_1 /TAXON_ID=2898 /ORGANISM="Cryptomonas paramecium" /LENGTH=92 /DNA_ID=CAMNT_0000577283 /DNA_START=227 /DNA_END=505 /DNA_ORIENTATION=+ /assembly_acc=CAM_ASM_000170